MKNIFTLLVFCLGITAMTYAQSEIRVIDVSPSRVAVQMKLGPSTNLLPGPGADICNPDVNNDPMCSELNFTLSWTDASIEGWSIVDEDDGDPCTPTSNAAACPCFTFPPFCPDLLPGPGYGFEALNTGDASGTKWANFAVFDQPCTDEGWIPAPVQWEANVWYTVCELDVTLAPLPPGVDPLVLTDMVSVDPGPSNGGVGPFDPNINTGNFTTGVESNTLAVNNDPLPLSLISFDANKEGEKSAKLEWTTANEINTKVFIIERSTDREIWEDVAGVEAAGNSSGIVEYSFIDKNVYTARTERQTFYYRLRMVDADDSFTYSNIDVVSFSNTFGEEENGFKLFVFPNPAKDGFNVEINQADDDNPITRLELLDITGRVVYSRDFDSGSLIEYVDFSRYNVTAGTYILKASDSEGALKTHEKIIVTR